MRFAVVVTGDHSTPVMFGDHSHEPVPVAIAHVNDLAAAPLPYTTASPASSNAAAPAVEDAWWRRVPLGALGPTVSQHTEVDGTELARQAREAASRLRAADAPGTRSARRCGDGVSRFDEVAAARGALGRFPGSELMPFLRSMLRVASP